MERRSRGNPYSSFFLPAMLVTRFDSTLDFISSFERKSASEGRLSCIVPRFNPPGPSAASFPAGCPGPLFFLTCAALSSVSEGRQKKVDLVRARPRGFQRIVLCSQVSCRAFLLSFFFKCWSASSFCSWEATVSSGLGRREKRMVQWRWPIQSGGGQVRHLGVVSRKLPAADVDRWKVGLGPFVPDFAHF